MNALQASERISKLQSRADALAQVIYYLDDDRDWQEELVELRELQEHAASELKHWTEKLSAVEL